jgi:Fe-S oxidoreductase
MEVEVENAKEEVKEIVERSVWCGRCNSLCPVLHVLREEHNSPRGKVVILNKGFFEKSVYDCTLCKACEKQCPLDLALTEAFLKARKVLVSSKKELSVNKEMIDNLLKTGNIYGIVEEKEEEEE